MTTDPRYLVYKVSFRILKDSVYEQSPEVKFYRQHIKYYYWFNTVDYVSSLGDSQLDQ